MLIVCTTDRNIVGFANSHPSARPWAPVHALPAGSQDAATARLRELVGQLGVRDPLLLSAHGHDSEIGDETDAGWGWDVDELADILRSAPDGWTGPLVFKTCGAEIDGLAAHLALALESRESCMGVWVHGYNQGVPVDEPFPAPGDPAIDQMRNPDFQWAQVGRTPRRA